ncbi:MAG: phosphate ABC transporter substrate-binding protein [Bacillota bacterium]
MVVAMAALVVSGCSGSKTAEPQKEVLKGTVTAVGSTAMQPLVERAAARFMEAHPEVQISVQGGGSGTGLSQVAAGACDIGNSDVFAEEKQGIDASQLVDHKVCVVGMAAVVNPGVTVDNLTQQQLIDIFTGKITNWKDVGGPDVKVVLVNRPKGSGTRATFKKFALRGAEEAHGIEEDSSGAVRRIIKDTPGAIGYLALSYLDGSVKAISLDGVAPTKENIVTGKYPVWAYQHMYTKGQPSGVTKAFLDYMFSDEVQTGLVTEMGYIPATEMKVERDWQGNVKPK